MRAARHILPLIIVLALVSCASMPQDRIAYNSIEGAKAGVAAAVKAWGELYAQGKYSDADREKVKAAYQKFEAAVPVAVDLAAVATDPANQTNALAYINAAAADVFVMLRQFEVIR